MTLDPEITIDEHGRPEPPVAAGETETLIGFLEYQRATFAWKCAGLDDASLRRATASSTMTLGGLMKHLAFVEDYWFSRRLLGFDTATPWNTVDWVADPDWEWHSAAVDTGADLVALWREAADRSRGHLASVLADGLDRLAAQPWPDGSAPSVRWILCHMIEEYARHNGHADILREMVDGQTGE
jgi:uncharacterized damage-inducible protein DinB